MTQQNLLLVVDLFLSNFGHFPGISDAITIRAIVLSRYRHFHRFLIIEENRTQLTGGAEQGGVLQSMKLTFPGFYFQTAPLMTLRYSNNCTFGQIWWKKFTWHSWDSAVAATSDPLWSHIIRQEIIFWITKPFLLLKFITFETIYSLNSENIS